MKNLRKIYISILSMTFIMLIFSTVTYAWITMSTINNIEGLSLTATTASELEISLDGITFGNQIDSSIIEVYFGNPTLKDVTSKDGVEFTRGGLRDYGLAVPNEDYMTFELWFRTTKREHGLYLINNVSPTVMYDTTAKGTYVVSRGRSWESNVDFLNGNQIGEMVYKGDVNFYYASQAVRISVEELKDLDNELDLRIDEDLKVFIYDPSENEVRGYGKPYGAYSYFAQRTGLFVEIPSDVPNTSYRLTEMDPMNPYQALDNDSLLAVLQETTNQNQAGKTYYQGKVRINIWIEGWDADAFDSIILDRIKMQLEFKIANPAQSL
ncbi:MAG: hypothetical protein Q7I99_02925 [Acholeplasmataceae bacterium]|nr:hypothetical protein [Acholeplasmataceae bacterium]